MFVLWLRKPLLCTAALLLSASASAKQEVFGWIEKASMPGIGVTAKVKMDTGALTSSIHATDVERFLKDDEKWVRFTVKLEDSNTEEPVTKTLERPFHRKVKISGAGGVDNRVVVFLDICIGDRLLREQFTLSDREDKKYGMLIGRRTMKHMGLVDVTQTFTSQPDCSQSLGSL
ncbi:ATP-dependent zinc protease family protein [Halioxenophilus aromaticivorans]|uniref:ATP-dependent zinc protease n=1 Tax=Halioxenophilus aromaticivorans TaxID=1306992 RepID=A0AAV3U992_9ALTE